MNMHTSELEEYKTEIAQLRNEVNDWKKKYFDCRRKVVAQAQYVSEINYFLIHFVILFGVRLFYLNLFSHLSVHYLYYHHSHFPSFLHCSTNPPPSFFPNPMDCFLFLLSDTTTVVSRMTVLFTVYN